MRQLLQALALTLSGIHYMRGFRAGREEAVEVLRAAGLVEAADLVDGSEVL